MCDRLKRKNGHKRDNLIKLLKSGFGYNVNGNSDYISVTQLISRNFPKFNADVII